MSADRNLLFGILALQMDFITRDQLIAAMHAWSLDKLRPLGEILVEQKALAQSKRNLLEPLVDQHVKDHGNDAQKSLAAISSVSSIREQLRDVPDADVQVSLGYFGVDSETTISHARSTAPDDDTRYRILRPHARGGIGEVFVAEDMQLHREVALKEIQTAKDRGETRSRFVLEAEITGGLEHPGIVPVYGLGHYADGRPYYAMRFIKGDNLGDAIRKFHQAQPSQQVTFESLDFRRLLQRFIDVCHAVAYAHSRGVLHRDLKPGNIMLGKYGETLVVDWGMAKVAGRIESNRAADGETTLQPSSGSDLVPTQYGSIIGTPAYMSPEQAEGKLDRLGPASDVYSLGATLYHLLVGKSANADCDRLEIQLRCQQGDIPAPRGINPVIPKPLEAICQKAMALKPTERYQTAQALAADIEHWLADEPVEAWREPITVQARRWMRRHRVLVSSLAALLVISTVALTISTVLVRKERDRAEYRFAQVQQAVNDYLINISSDERLKAVSLQPLRRKLLEKGLAYYQDLLSERGNDIKMRELFAAAQLRSAFIQQDLGAHATASAAYDKALPLYRQLVLERPNHRPYQIDLSRGYARLGELQEVGKDTRGAAGTTYQQALDILEPLSVGNSFDPDIAENLAETYSGLALLYKDDKAAEARKYARKALDLREQIVAQRPDDHDARRKLATACLSMAVFLNENRELKAAFSMYDRARKEWQSIASGGRDSEAKAHEGRILHDLATLYDQTGQKKESEAARRQALALREEVVYLQADDALDGLAYTYTDLAGQLASSGRRDEGLRHVGRAIEYRTMLTKTFGDSAKYIWMLAQSYGQMGSIQSGDDRLHDTALATLKQGLEILDRVPPDRRDKADFGQQRGQNLHHTGMLHLKRSGLPTRQADVRRQDLALANQAFQDALAIRRKLVNNQPDHPLFRRELNATLIMYGNVILRSDPMEAIKIFGTACEITSTLVRDYPGDPTMQSLHGVALHSLANAKYRSGLNLKGPVKQQRFGEAADTFEQAIVQQKKAVDEMPDVLDFRRLLVYHYQLIAELRNSLDNPQAAAAAVKLAAEQALVRQELGADDSAVQIDVARELCKCCELLGSGNEQSAERQKYTDKAIESIRRAVELGFKDGKRLQHDDLKFLRGKPEFDSITKLLTADAVKPGVP